MYSVYYDFRVRRNFLLGGCNSPCPSELGLGLGLSLGLGLGWGLGWGSGSGLGLGLELGLDFIWGRNALQIASSSWAVIYYHYC